MFGPVVYEAFRQVKRGVRPGQPAQPRQGRRRPGDEGEPPRAARPRPPPDPPTVLDYSKQGGFFRSVELCNGAGVCRKTQGGAMCPSYRATRDERDTTRARANALRIALVASRQTGEPEPRPTPDSASPIGPGRALDRRGDGPVPVVQGVQDRVPEQRRRGEAEGRVPARVLRAPAAAARPPAREERPPAVARSRPGSPGSSNWLGAAAVRALGDGELRRHRPPPQPAGVAPRPLPPLVRPANGRSAGDGRRADAGRESFCSTTASPRTRSRRSAGPRCAAGARRVRGRTRRACAAAGR